MPLASRFLAEQTELDIERLRKDISVLAGLAAEQLNAVRSFLAQGQNLLWREEVLGEQIQALYDANGIAPLQFAAARRLSLFCMRARLEHDEGIDTMISGLETIGAFQELQEDQTARVRGFLAGLAEALEFCARTSSREGQLAKSMPSLIAVSFSTNLRVVLRREFRPLQDEVASYQPAIVEFVPVGIVHLGTNETGCRISFQLDQQHLDKLLDSLLALKKELEEGATTLVKKGVPVPDVRAE